MNLRHILNPWGRIAELERELSKSEAYLYVVRRARNNLQSELQIAERQARFAQADFEGAKLWIDKLTAEIAALKAAQQPRDPVTGRMRAKVKG